MRKITLLLASLSVAIFSTFAPCLQGQTGSSPTATRPASAEVGEKVPSEDPLIKDLHSLGLINGRTNIFRSASPVRDLIKNVTPPPEESAIAAEARTRLQHLHDLGIRTIFSLEDADPADITETAAEKAAKSRWINLEKTAAAQAGIAFISRPLANSGPNSFQTFSSPEVYKLLDTLTAEILQHASTGGVLFHCAAGHDRTGITAAFLRMKVQRWPVDQAIDEMRRYGHNWPKLSSNNGVSSWHEDHLRDISQLISIGKAP